MCALFQKTQVNNFIDKVNEFKEKTSSFKCESIQPIGAIPNGGDVTLKLDPGRQVLIIRYSKKTEITLTYTRIAGFRLECITSFSEDKNSKIAGVALASGILGRTARMAGNILMDLKKQENRWIATLIYIDKEGETKELNFVQKQGSEYYDSEQKDASAAKFERMVNEIACRVGEGITEL